MIHDRATTVFVHCFLLGGVAIVLMLQEIDHCSGTFLFCNSSSVYFGCVHPYCHYGTTLLQRLGVIGISAILINTLYRKNQRHLIWKG
jgi:hypothetical protein